MSALIAVHSMTCYSATHVFVLCVIAIRFIHEAECEEVTRLRIDLLRKKGDQEKLCNLIGWCLRSERYDDDTDMLVEHFTLLHSFGRIDEFIQRVSFSFDFTAISLPYL